MEIKDAIPALGALAQESRLAVFRLLVEAGEDGLPAGHIAQQLGVPHNTLSSHLAILQQAGLAASRRDGRSIIYSVNPATVRDLLGFLLEDCCGGRPQLCAPVLDQVAAGCLTGPAQRTGT